MAEHSTSTAAETAAAAPTFSIAAGTYMATQSVKLADATSGAIVYYTTNGTAPTTASTRYSAAITVSASETIKAIAAATGHTNSAVASAAYIISSPGRISDRDSIPPLRFHSPNINTSSPMQDRDF